MAEAFTIVNQLNLLGTYKRNRADRAIELRCRDDANRRQSEQIGQIDNVLPLQNLLGRRGR